MYLACFDTLYLNSWLFCNLNVEKNITTPKPYNSCSHLFIFSLVNIFFVALVITAHELYLNSRNNNKCLFTSRLECGDVINSRRLTIFLHKLYYVKVSKYVLFLLV